ncbi:hypothetical protein BgiMline_023126, partial [Biomphalaria glabrata]
NFKTDQQPRWNADTGYSDLYLRPIKNSRSDINNSYAPEPRVWNSPLPPIKLKTKFFLSFKCT